jgi:cation transporter-like permease
MPGVRFVSESTLILTLLIFVACCAVVYVALCVSLTCHRERQETSPDDTVRSIIKYSELREHAYLPPRNRT